MTQFKNTLSKAASEYGLEFSANQIETFDLYYKMLLDYNQRLNLTAITAPEEVAVKHVIDSLSCCRSDVFTQGSSVLDLGTGAGFPGLALKIFRPDLDLVLMDSLKKRLAFLQEVISSLGIDARIIHSRAETAGKDKEHREQYNIVVSRAVAKMPVLCEYCLPFVAVGGWFAALKGANYEEELAAAAKAVSVLGGAVERILKVNLPHFPDKRAVIYIKKITSTPAVYPRREGIPEKNPL